MKNNKIIYYCQYYYKLNTNNKLILNKLNKQQPVIYNKLIMTI